MLNSVKIRLWVLVIISLASMLILYLNQSIYLSRIELYKTANNEILSMNVDILQLRHAEKKFFVENNQQYLSQHENYLEHFRQTLKTLIGLAQKVEVENPDLLGLLTQIEDYRQRFQVIIRDNHLVPPQIRLKRYQELNLSADKIEASLKRMQQALNPHFDESLQESKNTSSIIVIITACVLLLTIIISYRALTRSFDAFLNFFHNAKTIHETLDGDAFSFTEFRQMASVANEMIEARRGVELQLKHLNENLEERVEDGISEIKNLNFEIEETQKEVVLTMGAIGESRSKETGNHVKRVAEFSRILALEYGLDTEQAEMLKSVSPMHDIGKIAIPDSILNKEGQLNEKERLIMDTHTTLGYDMLKGSNKPLFQAASIVAYEHHEKWDGSGYPRGLKGEEIHIFGRITAVVDVFDALASDRCYKTAWPDNEIISFLQEQSDKHFDPELIDLFIKNQVKFFKVREQYRDIF